MLASVGIWIGRFRPDFFCTERRSVVLFWLAYPPTKFCVVGGVVGDAGVAQPGCDILLKSQSAHPIHQGRGDGFAVVAHVTPCHRHWKRWAILTDVTIGDYSGVPMQDDGDTWRTGAVFLLRHPAAADAVVPLNGWVTSVKSGSRAVVTTGPSTATDHAGTFLDAMMAANQGLDYMSATGRTHSVIADANNDSIVWWPDSAGVVTMRATIVLDMGFGGAAAVAITDSPHSAVPQPVPPAPMAQNVFRFMRMAKTSGDLFDAYRNMFLAFECLLDDIHPHLNGPEGQWFKAALGVANSMVPVAKLAPSGEADPIEWVYRNMYGDERSALMHAKQHRTYLLPQDSASRASLQASLETLWQYVRELVPVHLKVTTVSAHLFASGWAMIADPRLREMALFVSNDGSQMPTDEPSGLGPTATTIEMQPGTPSADPSDSMLRCISSVWPAVNLSGIDGITKIGAKVPGIGSPVLVLSELVGPLRLGQSVSTFEVLHGVRSISANGAPAVFSS